MFEALTVFSDVAFCPKWTNTHDPDPQNTVSVKVQLGSVTQSRLSFCNPMDCSTPGLPVHHQLPEFTQTHVHKQWGRREEPAHWKTPWCWERLKAGGEGDDRGWDGWLASPTWWTWVWVSSGSWWLTGKPGVLQSMGSQRVVHGWATELKWLPLTN